MFPGNTANSNNDSNWHAASVWFERTVSTGGDTTALDSPSAVIHVTEHVTLGDARCYAYGLFQEMLVLGG